MWRLGKVCIQPSLPIKWQWHRRNGNKDLPDTLGKAMSWARIRKGKTGSEINARFVAFSHNESKIRHAFSNSFLMDHWNQNVGNRHFTAVICFLTKCTSTIATNNPEGCLRRAYDATFNVFLHSYKIKQIFKVWILQKKPGFHHAIP